MLLWLGGGMEEGTKLDKKPLCSCPGCNPVPLTTDKIYHWATYGKAAERGAACGKMCNSRTAKRALLLHWKQYLMLCYAGPRERRAPVHVAE